MLLLCPDELINGSIAFQLTGLELAYMNTDLGNAWVFSAHISTLRALFVDPFLKMFHIFMLSPL